MTKHSYWFLMLAGLLAVMMLPAPALADVPSTFTLDAQVFEAGSDGGFSYDGTVRVDLFDDPDLGSSLWNETHTGVFIDGGLLTLTLGSVNTGTLPAILISNAGTPIYLEVRLQGIGYTFPVRLPVSSVPYALVCSEAGNAETFQNMEPSAFAFAGHGHAWGEITGKPAEFTPEAHDHTVSDISDWPTILDDSQISWSEVQSKPSTFAPDSHDHPWSDITSVPADLSDGEISWSEVVSKPSTFDAAPHDHAWSEITNVPSDLVDGEISWTEVQNKPSTFTPATHDHNSLYYTETEMDGFLSGKANVGASYTKAQSDAAYLAIGGKAADSDKLDGEDSSYYATQGGLDTTNTNLDSLSGDLSTNYYTKTQSDSTFAVLTALQALTTRVGQLETDLDTAEGTISTLQTDLDTAESTIAELEDPDCPLGYERSTAGDDANYIVCKNGSDELVKVGDFWVDRYETTIVDVTKYASGSCDGSSGTFYGRSDGDAHTAGFFRNGMDDPPNTLTREDFVPLYACSLEDQTPSRWITWFQAERACNLAGKHLCTNAEWQGAAYGTPDDSTSCNISTSGPQTGAARPDCMSDYGAVNMVGNLWEWTANWYGQGADSDDGNQPNAGEFHGDGYWNVDNAQSNGSYTEGNPVFPASALRGGAWNSGSEAGVFALYLDTGPARWTNGLGARCCRR